MAVRNPTSTSTRPSVTESRPKVYVGLGANLGPTLQTLNLAIEQLRIWSEDPQLLASPFYRSQAQGAQGPELAPDYLNAVVAFETLKSPEEILIKLLEIEHSLGRERSYPNASRTIDLDLLLVGNAVIHSERLTLPHPRMHARAFVLRPLHDLAPDLILHGTPINDLLAQCASQYCERL